ncbi:MULTISPECIES: energy transducer TonB [unclassified Sphingobium]|uniref:energy transducer TonB n=1 Tax=unclassified Sphingobium TaxID=2611147 RepID=UPI001E4EAB79|nr:MULTISPECIES: energy transducer TonB [unclassified Sphingobium]GLI96974.1 hypothetical protein Sbs19_07920 [Sphingobium sp. BS19]CAH0349107.1 hypothetical protein SPH9361_00439 [Sphingobium sp. CECT 9361]
MLLSRKSAYAAQGYTGSAPSRVGIAGTIAVHAILVGGYFLIPAQMIKTILPTPIFIKNIPLPQDPPEVVVEQKAATKPQPAQADNRPFVPDPTFDFKPAIDNPGTPIKFDSVDIKPFDPGIIDSPRNPVLTAVSPDPRYMRDFQPDYPPAMQRAQEEGKVTVRVTIGADGRVTDIEKIFATTDAFWEATRAQAMRKWRFRAATRDGVSVASEKVMTVHFQLS